MIGAPVNGASPRMRTLLLYAQDTRGMGHITRTLTIANHLLATFPHCVAYVVTRSNIAPEVAWPRHCDLIKLPSRRTPAGFERTPEDEQASLERFRGLRSQILRDTALGLAPDLVFLDHEPLGSSGEFRDGLWALKHESPGTRFVFGLRDIMDDPDHIRKKWREMGVYDALENLYDGIAVFGSRQLYDVAEAYDIPESVRPKLFYCGFVVRNLVPATPEEIRRQYGLPANGRLVVASVGSGRDGSAVLGHAHSAIARLQARDPDLSAVVVTGPFMSEEEAAALQPRATERCRQVASADVFQLMAVADAAVCMGGYNTLCEGLMTACPLVIVPRATHKVEQLIRAELLASHDLARCIHPSEAGAESLAEALEWALARDRQTQAQRVREVVPSFNGAAQLTGYLSPWLNGG